MGGPPSPTSYASLDFNAPLSDTRAETIARALAEAEPATILDIGCGWGELLLRVVSATATGRGWGIDSDPAVLARGRTNAASGGLADRVVFVEGLAPTEHEPADVVICVGADHAWGSQADALAALHGFVQPGGQLLFGTGFWERFESGYLTDWELWLHRYGDGPEAAEIRANADTHRNQWLRGYRDLLGFAYLTLERPLPRGAPS